MNVLIVDDVPSNLRLLRAQLEAEGCSVTEASDGLQALEAIEAGEIDVVISDTLMPNMDGYRLCYEVRSNKEISGLPFVMYTATYTSPADQKLCFDFGADEYLRKPATTKDILRSIDIARAASHNRPALAVDKEEILRQFSEQLMTRIDEKNILLAATAEQVRLQVTALETADNAILITNRRGVIEWVNPAFTAQTGFSPQEAIGQTPRILKSGKQDAEFYREFWKTIAGGKTWRGEFTNCRKDGELYYDEHTVTPVFSTDGTITHFVGIMHDVTDRKRAEEEIRSTHAQLNHLLANSPAVIYALKIQGEEIIPRIVSQNITELLGFDVSEVMTFDWWAGRLHPADRDRAFASLRETLANGFSTTEYRLRHKSGTYRQVEDKRRLTYDSANKPEEIVGVWSDITDRKEMEEALRKSEVRFREMLEHVEMIAMILDTNDTVLFCNDYVLRLTGWERVHVLGCDVFKRFFPESDREGVRAVFNSVNADSLPAHLETRIQTKSGELRDIVWNNTVLRDPSGAVMGTATIGEDVTERNRATQALKKALEETERQVEERTSTLEHTNEELVVAKLEADRANAAKSEFLSGMSHELRTPLNAILGFAQLLEMDAHTEKQRDSIDHILGGGRHLLDLINKILELSRIESGNVEISIEPVSVSEVIKETTLLVHQMAHGAGVRLIDQTQGSEIYVQADRLRLRQVLMNLLSNAIKYNVKGGSATVTATSMNGQGMIEIEDTGVGIPNEMEARLFVPFDRLGAASRRVEGTGLGLSISRKFCESMDGTIKYRPSDQGQGSTFTIVLPRVDKASIDSGSRTQGVDSNSLTLAGPCSIVYIEDNPANLELVQTILSRFPEVSLFLATSGNEGLELALQHKPDLILLDLNLPDISGTEVLQRIKDNPVLRDTTVIIVSADATEGQIRRLTEMGVYAYLTKPLVIAQLLKLLNQLLSRCGSVRAAPKPISPLHS